MSQPLTLLSMIQTVSTGRWFKEPSTFRCAVEIANPKLCVITGPNASGKSLLRKILHNHCHEVDVEYMHLSQNGRCGSGIVKAMIYGNEDDESTGRNSIHTFLTAIKTGQGRDKPFVLMFDEPEIGCSEELQMAMAIRLVRDFETMPNMVGILIITHGRNIVKPLLPLAPSHWRLSLDGMTLDQWVSREIVPVESLEDLKDQSHKSWVMVNSLKKK